MGRIREYIRINGMQCWTRFDSGARNTYVTPQVASHLTTTELPKAIKTALGGGALAMQQWGIRLLPEEERLDLTHFPKEFVEY